MDSGASARPVQAGRTSVHTSGRTLVLSGNDIATATSTDEQQQQDADGGDVIVDLQEPPQQPGCCTKYAPSTLAKLHPTIFAIMTAFIYYSDFGTDINFALKMFAIANDETECEEAGKARPEDLAYMVLGILLFHPIALSVADLVMKGGMGMKGVLLNLFNVRMLYSLVTAIRGGPDAAAAARSTNDVKLFEAVMEAMPQAYIQFVVLLHWKECVGADDGASHFASFVGSLYFSLAISTLSMVFAIATKFEHLFDRSGDAGFTLAVWLYFAADSISRGLAVAMAYGAGGGEALAAVGGGWVMLDLVVQLLQGARDWSSIPAAALSLFTSMPLSTRKRDMLRLFLISTIGTLGMALAATFLGYQALLEPQNAGSNSSGSGSFGSGKMQGDVGEVEPVDIDASLSTLVVVFAMVFVKVMVYTFQLRGGKLMVGKGAQEAAGFSALFALSNDAGSQMASWAVNDWATFAKDPDNAKVDLSSQNLGAAVGKNIAAGIKMAGVDCKIAELK